MNKKIGGLILSETIYCQAKKLLLNTVLLHVFL